MPRERSFSGQESGDDTEAMEAYIFEDPQRLHRPGDGNTFPWVRPAFNVAGNTSNRAPAAKGAMITIPNRKDRSTDRDTGTAGANRSRAVGAGASSQCANSAIPYGDSRAGRTGACSNGLVNAKHAVGEVIFLWAAPSATCVTRQVTG